MNIKNIAIGIAILVVILVFGFLGALIDTSMQEKVRMQNYEAEMVKEWVSFPESSYSESKLYDRDAAYEEEYVEEYAEEYAPKSPRVPSMDVSTKTGAEGKEKSLPSAEFPTSPGGEPTYEIGQKLIKNSRLDFDVENYDEAYNRVSMIAANAGGYVSDSKEAVYTTGDYKRKGGYVVIRIPADEFNSVISQIGAIGNLTSKNINVEDVTQQYIDLSSRLRNAKAEEERFLKIMENATNVEDMLAVEKEIGRVRAEIEVMQGQMNYMNNRIDLATIHINMQEPAKEEHYEPPGHEWGIREAIDNAIDGFLGTTRGLIIIFGYLLPILIVFGIIYFIHKKFKRKEEKVAKKEKKK